MDAETLLTKLLCEARSNWFTLDTEPHSHGDGGYQFGMETGLIMLTQEERDLVISLIAHCE